MHFYLNISKCIMLDEKYRRPPQSTGVQGRLRGCSLHGRGCLALVPAWSRRTCSRVEADCPPHLLRGHTGLGRAHWSTEAFPPPPPPPPSPFLHSITSSRDRALSHAGSWLPSYSDGEDMSPNWSGPASPPTIRWPDQ